MDSFSTYLRVMGEYESEQDYHKLVKELVTEVDDLRRQSAQQQNQITKLQQELIKAGKFANDDPDKLVAGVQVFLKRAGEAVGRDKGRKRG